MTYWWPLQYTNGCIVIKLRLNYSNTSETDLKGIISVACKMFLIFPNQHARNRQIAPFEKIYSMAGKTHSGKEHVGWWEGEKMLVICFIQSSLPLTVLKIQKGSEQCLWPFLVTNVHRKRIKSSTWLLTCREYILQIEMYLLKHTEIEKIPLISFTLELWEWKHSKEDSSFRSIQIQSEGLDWYRRKFNRELDSASTGICLNA